MPNEIDDSKVQVLEDWDYSDFRALDAISNAVAKMFGYRCLHGLLDGKRIETGPFVKWDGKYAWVSLANPTPLKLGEPKKEYVEFCRKAGVHVPTKEQPFKVWSEDEISAEEFEERQKRAEKLRK